MFTGQSVPLDLRQAMDATTLATMPQSVGLVITMVFSLYATQRVIRQKTTAKATAPMQARIA